MDWHPIQEGVVILSVASQTRTQSLFMSLGERERRLDSIETRGDMGRDEGKIATGRFRTIETCILPQRRAARFFTETALNSEDTWISCFGRWKVIFPRRAGRRYQPYFNRKQE